MSSAPAAVAAKPVKARLGFLDWARGLAATVMLQGHVLHSFTRNEEREQGVYVLSQFIGGVAPALFLFLTGVTYAFLMHSRERQGLTLRERLIAALRRSGYLLTLAVLFRFQLWLFAWNQSPWTDLFKVDVLNCMALSLLVLSPLALTTTAQRVRHAGVAGLVIALLGPVISQMDWSWLHPFIRAYFVPDGNYFSFFPWASFVAFGVSFGSGVRAVEADKIERAVQWGALVGIGAFMCGYYLSGLPYSVYAKSDFWLDSPALTLIKLGVILLVVAGAYLWMLGLEQTKLSWIRLLGTNSLLVYWVHIELVYGRWFGEWKTNLTTPQAVTAAVVLIFAMIQLCRLRTRFRDFRPLRLGSVSLKPSGAAGD